MKVKKPGSLIEVEIQGDETLKEKVEKEYWFSKTERKTSSSINNREKDHIKINYRR